MYRNNRIDCVPAGIMRGASCAALSLFALILCSCPEKPGSLRAISAPSGAAVWLDSANTAETTNCVITGLTPGLYKVTLKLTGFADKTKGVEVKGGETSSVYGWFRLARGWTQVFAVEGEGTDEARVVRQTPDDGYLVAGSKYGTTTGKVLLTKLNADGEPLWIKGIASSEMIYGRAMELTPDNNCIIAGASRHAWDSMDLLLVKTGPDGTPIWSKTFDWARYDVAYGVQPTSDGGFVVAGYTGDDSLGYDLLLMKTDANGDTQWVRRYGGQSWDMGYSLRATRDGGYIVAGITLSLGSYDIWLVKTDAQGDSEWTRTFGGLGEEFGYAAAQTADGGYIVVGSTRPPAATDMDLYITKTDALGNTLWTKTLGGHLDEVGYDVIATADGGSLVTGYTESFSPSFRSLWLVKLAANGDTMWTRVYGVHNEGYSVQVTSDSGYVAAGIGVLSDLETQGIYVVKTFADGNTVDWWRQ